MPATLVAHLQISTSFHTASVGYRLSVNRQAVPNLRDGNNSPYPFPIASFTAGITFSAISSIERRPSAGSIQSWQA